MEISENRLVTLLSNKLERETKDIDSKRTANRISASQVRNLQRLHRVLILEMNDSPKTLAIDSRLRKLQEVPLAPSLLHLARHTRIRGKNVCNLFQKNATSQRDSSHFDTTEWCCYLSTAPARLKSC